MKNYNNNQPQINPNAHISRLDAKIQRKISYNLNSVDYLKRIFKCLWVADLEI